MDNVYRRVQKNALSLFVGSLLLVLLFVVAIKLNVLMTAGVIGEPLPQIEAGDWINRAGTRDEPIGEGRAVTFLFFWKPGIEISDEMLIWGVRWDKKFRTAGLRVIGIASVPDKASYTRERLNKILKQTGVEYDTAIDTNGEYRKKLLHRSFSTYYVADRASVIRAVGNAADGMEKAEKDIVRFGGFRLD